MGILIRQNDNGTMTVECGAESLTIVQKSTSKPGAPMPGGVVMLVADPTMRKGRVFHTTSDLPDRLTRVGASKTIDIQIKPRETVDLAGLRAQVQDHCGPDEELEIRLWPA